MATRTAYFLNGQEVERPLSLVHNNTTYVPPTDEQLLAAGYEIREVETTATSSLSYEERVVELIRQRYSLDEELAILRQRDSKADEFEEYNTYCEQCKAQAKEETV